MKTIIVTGDSKGLGSKIARKILETEQYEIIGLSRTETDVIQQFEKKYPNMYTHVNFDLSNPDKIRELYLSSLKPKGPIYGLVNNAAMAYDDLVSNANVNDLRQTFAVNVISPILLTKYALRDMILNHTEGALVHISSVSTMTGYRGLSMYGSSKGALESFSLGVAREWGERNIRSNCVAPGFMDTDMTSTLDDQQKDRIYDRTSLGEPTDQISVAETVTFLLSDAAKSITGEVIRVDSGTV